jgi:hypothetical protein
MSDGPSPPSPSGRLAALRAAVAGSVGQVLALRTSPRYGGPNGGPLKATITDPVEREIREAFDHFDDVYLRGKDHWLTRQRTGRLCEDIIRIMNRSKQ